MKPPAMRLAVASAAALLMLALASCSSEPEVEVTKDSICETVEPIAESATNWAAFDNKSDIAEALPALYAAQEDAVEIGDDDQDKSIQLMVWALEDSPVLMSDTSTASAFLLQECQFA